MGVITISCTGIFKSLWRPQKFHPVFSEEVADTVGLALNAAIGGGLHIARVSAGNTLHLRG